MTIDFASTSLTPFIPPGLMSNNAAISGATQADRIKAAAKAIEGMFAGQLMAELGKGMGGPQEAQESGLYQDFIQQAMAQEVSAGGGFGLAKMLEDSLMPKHHAPVPPHPKNSQ
jgi:Rod binding domain-containing protein